MPREHAPRPQPVARRDGQRPRQAARLDPARGALPRPRQARGRAYARPRTRGPHRAGAARPSRACGGALVSGRRMIEVGLRGTGDVGVELHDRAGRLVSSARFTHGLCRALALRGGRPVSLRPALHGRRPERQASRRAWRSASQRAARPPPPPPPPPPPRRPGPHSRDDPAADPFDHRPRRSPRAARQSCTSRPQKKFAHGGDGAVDHRFHARPAISSNGRYVAFDLPAAGIVPRDHNVARRLRPRCRTGAHRAGERRARRRGRQRDEPGRPRSAPAGTSSRSSPRHRTSSPATATACATSSCATCAAGTTRRIGPGRSPALSADGRFVAFEGSGGVVVADLAAGTQGRVATGRLTAPRSAPTVATSRSSRVARSPSATRTSNLQVDRLDRETGAAVLLSAGPDGPSRSGQSLAAVLSADGSARGISVRRAADAQRPQRAARRLRPRRRRAPHDARQRQPLRAPRRRLQPLPLDQRRRPAPSRSTRTRPTSCGALHVAAARSTCATWPRAARA